MDVGWTENCQTEGIKTIICYLYTELWLHDSVIPQIWKNPHRSSSVSISGWYLPSEEDRPSACLLLHVAIGAKEERWGEPMLQSLNRQEGTLLVLVQKLWLFLFRLVNLPARMALWALNSCPLTYRLQSVKRDCSHRFPRSSESWHSGTFSMFMLDWPEMFTESWTTLTCRKSRTTQMLDREQTFSNNTSAAFFFFFWRNKLKFAIWDEIKQGCLTSNW